MTISRIECDKCGAAIAEGRTLLHTMTGPMRLHRPAIDLCTWCADELFAWLATPPGPAGTIDRSTTR